jgi:putative transposase
VRFRKSSHAVYNTQYHIVWTPRYRRKVLAKGIKEYLEKVITNLDFLDQDIEVKEVNVRVDHIHLAIVIPPRIAVAKVIQFIKSQTAKKLKTKFEYLDQVITKPGLWSRGYCASTIGLNEKKILNYIKHQERDDKGQIELDLDKSI